MKEFLKIIGVLLLIVLVALPMYSCFINSDVRDITVWVNARGEKANTIEFRQFSIGPYWHMKNARYYYVKTDKNIYWVKYLFGRTIKTDDGKEIE